MADSAVAIVDRDEPPPVIAVTGTDGASSDGDGKRDRPRRALPGSKLKGKLQDVAGVNFGESGHSLQDRLFSKLLQQVIPIQGADEVDVEEDRVPFRYLNRPAFSLPLMTNNFRRFNARIGVVFAFQNQVLRLLTWQKASHTLSFFAVYTFVCLNPYLLAVLPLIVVLFFLFVPAFLIRHPPPPDPVGMVGNIEYTLAGPPTAPARVIRPAAEASKDFFRNMRDIQNLMDDFSTVHDLSLDIFTPLTNFSNEPLSSALFGFLFLAVCLLFPSSHLLPWRYISLVFGWTAIALGHPSVQEVAINSFYKPHIRPASETARSWLDSWITLDIVLDAPPETREVEVFELQRRTGSNPLAAVEWEPWIFSPTAWEPMAPGRIAGERLKGTRFFEDVMVPTGWQWAGKKWELDLGSAEWVEERLLAGVEVELDGERWVYDIAQDEKDHGGDEKPRKRGEWRRRRWLRMVRRKATDAMPTELPRGQKKSGANNGRA